MKRIGLAWWDVSDIGVLENVKEAEEILVEMRENGEEIPEGMTPEDLFREWNENVIIR